MSLLMVAWGMMGALGALFCAWALGGPESLPDFMPLSLKGMFRLLVACGIGALGGILGGMTVQGVNAESQSSPQLTGGTFGAVLGALLAPFLTFGLYHLLEYRLRQSRAPDGRLGWRVMGSAGWVVVLVAPALGFMLGGNLGAVSGSDGFFFGALFIPFAGGVFLFIIPLLFWLIGRADSCYRWDNDIRPDARQSEGVAGD